MRLRCGLHESQGPRASACWRLHAACAVVACAAYPRALLRQRVVAAPGSPPQAGPASSSGVCFGRPVAAADPLGASGPCVGYRFESNASWSREAAKASKRWFGGGAKVIRGARPEGLVNAGQMAKDARNSSVMGQHPRNLCMDVRWGPGVAPDMRLAPEFILLGAQKAGTSSFAFMFYHEDVAYTYVIGNEPQCLWKEAHIFDNWVGRWDMGKAFWLYHYPPCVPGYEKRVVATDMTPSYLPDPEAPARMRKFYGERSADITFGVILRDPLARMHSAFYFYQHQNWCAQEHLDGGFKRYVQGVLHGDDPCKLASDGNYTEQLQRYFGVFSPTQFVVFPYKEITAPKAGVATTISDLWQRLGLEARAPPRVQYSNYNFHSTLQQDLDVGTLAAIRAHIDETMGPQQIARLLSAGDRRPTLAGYAGDGGDPAAVAAWLRAKW